MSRRSTYLLAAAVTAAGVAAAQAAPISYYRFEDGTAGNDVPGDAPGSVGTVIDSIDPANNLNVFNLGSGGTFSADVPVATIPQTGQANTLSVDFNGTEDIYGDVGLPEGAGVSFTLETYVKSDTLGSFQTYVGRDDGGDTAGNGPLALFYLSKAGVGPFVTDAFRVELTTDTGAQVAVNSASVAQADTWYHLAAVGDASAGTLELFVDGSSVGSSAGYTGLFDSNTIWTFGRGFFGGSADRLDGHLDEVRFSDSALAPSEFLNAVPEPTSLTLLLAGGLALAARRRRA